VRKKSSKKVIFRLFIFYAASPLGKYTDVALDKIQLLPLYVDQAKILTEKDE
jgi:hypothetical protein